MEVDRVNPGCRHGWLGPVLTITGGVVTAGVGTVTVARVVGVVVAGVGTAAITGDAVTGVATVAGRVVTGRTVVRVVTGVNFTGAGTTSARCGVAPMAGAEVDPGFGPPVRGGGAPAGAVVAGWGPEVADRAVVTAAEFTWLAANEVTIPTWQRH